MIIGVFIAVVILGYLLGSIPFGWLLTRRCVGVDVRQHGSGKIGMTNVLRTAGKKVAAAVFVLDLLKGMLAVVLAGLIVGKGHLVVGGFGLGILLVQVMAALAAVAGHNWSVFLKFKGGRGVVTYFGGLVALFPPAAIFGAEIFALGTGLTRYASIGSIVGVVSTYIILVPLTILHGFPIEYLVYSFIGTVVIILMHRDNIVRLMSGKERRLGDEVGSESIPLSTLTSSRGRQRPQTKRTG